MKAHLNLPIGVVEVEAETQVGLFEEISSAYEVFCPKECGACKSQDITPRTRVVSNGRKTYTYHEWVCNNPSCRSRLAMGQNIDKPKLFPKRKDKSGKWLVNNGWEKYDPNKPVEDEMDEVETTPPPRQLPSRGNTTNGRLPARGARQEDDDGPPF